MCKVSIVVPFYNVEQYIEKCLNSLINQTLNKIEIILVNDGSQDKSAEIAKSFFKKYPDKIKYFEKTNGGLSDARNYGMKYATGEYIAFLDSDDYVENDMYEKMYNLAKKENSDMVECDFYWEYPKKVKVDFGKIYNTKNEMIENIRVVAWNKLIKKEALDKSQIQFPKGLRYEDVEFTYKLIPYINKVSFCKYPFIHYIQRENSISNVQNARTKEIFEVLQNVIKYYKDNNIFDQYKDELEYIYARYAFCSSLLRIAKIKDKETKNILIKETWKNVYNNFPNWKKNIILKKRKSLKNFYLKSINKITYKLYCMILAVI